MQAKSHVRQIELTHRGRPGIVVYVELGQSRVTGPDLTCMRLGPDPVHRAGPTCWIMPAHTPHMNQAHGLIPYTLGFWLTLHHSSGLQPRKVGHYCIRQTILVKVTGQEDKRGLSLSLCLQRLFEELLIPLYIRVASLFLNCPWPLGINNSQE